jgi:hypothetical protein
LVEIITKNNGSEGGREFRAALVESKSENKGDDVRRKGVNGLVEEETKAEVG